VFGRFFARSRDCARKDALITGKTIDWLTFTRFCFTERGAHVQFFLSYPRAITSSDVVGSGIAMSIAALTASIVFLFPMSPIIRQRGYALCGQELRVRLFYVLTTPTVLPSSSYLL
jgi:hypothetical protein